MALQVGSFCYASLVEAGRATCSQFNPLTTINGNEIKTVTCAGSDLATGDLQLSVVVLDMLTNSSSTQTYSHALSYPPCIQQDYIDAAEVVIGAVLVIYVFWICGWKLLSFLGWTRGENA